MEYYFIVLESKESIWFLILVIFYVCLYWYCLQKYYKHDNFLVDSTITQKKKYHIIYYILKIFLSAKYLLEAEKLILIVNSLRVFQEN